MEAKRTHARRLRKHLPPQKSVAYILDPRLFGFGEDFPADAGDAGLEAHAGDNLFEEGVLAAGAGGKRQKAKKLARRQRYNSEGKSRSLPAGGQASLRTGSLRDRTQGIRGITALGNNANTKTPARRQRYNYRDGPELSPLRISSFTLLRLQADGDIFRLRRCNAILSL